ncbi:putative LPS assembly protein LptD [Bacteroides ovatus]|uniref:putative LPS assembly protein LptD n=1 Tax=Bacteroides ovatus TaxID=28116 RepID=UPI00189E429E
MKTHLIITFLLIILPSVNGMWAQSADISTRDSVKTDSVGVKKKDGIRAPITYEATDSIVLTGDGIARLYGSGKVNYEKIELTAEIISVNMDSSTVHAYGVPDSLGIKQGTPVFKDGETPYEAEAIRYNLTTKKAFVYNIVNQQGEGYVTGKEAKKGPNDDIFMENAKYTTCDHHDHPHFYLQLTKAKVKPKKNVVTGPAYLVVEDVPLPIAVPFFFFPFTTNYSSGVIMPKLMDDSARGFGLNEGGYYFAISDKMDLKLTGDIFTKESWAIRMLSNYNKRYKYSGSLQADYQVTKTGDKNMPDYSVSKDFKILWNHRQDPKANPNINFSASVNFSTSSYERTNINNLYDPGTMTQNTKTSSISYQRTLFDKRLNISGTFNIAQSMKDSSLSMTLPDLNISLAMFYPFKRKHSVGNEKWYEKISLKYTGRLTNSIDTKDNLLFKSGIRKWKTAMEHSIPLSATFSLFTYVNVTPTIDYHERWYTRKVMKEYDMDKKQLEQSDTIYGFNRVYDYRMSVSLNTKLYGMYKPIFLKKKEILIRHVITPTVTISGAPGFKQFYEDYTDAFDKKLHYSPFEGQPYGVPSHDGSGMVNFELSNNLEMKYKLPNDSIKKISLIDEFSVGMSYDLAAKEKPWGDLDMNLRLKLTKSYTFSMNARFATYAYTFDKDGNVTDSDRTEWSYGRFGRFQGYSSSFSYTFNNETWGKWFDKKEDIEAEKKEEKASTTEEIAEEEGGATKQKRTQQAEVDKDGYQVFKLPWSINISYSYSIHEDKSKPINVHNMHYPYSWTRNLNLTGNFKISNRWSFTFSSGYDFQAKEITQTSCTVSRDLHCFSMSASFAPFGKWKYYSFRIGCNASMLQDLKWDKRSQTSNTVQWY